MPVIPAPVFTRVNSGGNPVVIKENPGFRIKSGMTTKRTFLLLTITVTFDINVSIVTVVLKE